MAGMARGLPIGLNAKTSGNRFVSAIRAELRQLERPITCDPPGALPMNFAQSPSNLGFHGTPKEAV
jgi:hypothetical protein